MNLEIKNKFSNSLKSWMDAASQITMGAVFHYAKEKNISIPQLLCMMRLHKKGTCQVSGISENFSISMPAASQLLDKLVQSHYVNRWEDENDRRIRHHGLGAEGKNLIDELFTRQKTNLMKMAEFLTEEECITMSAILEKLTIKINEMIPQDDVHGFHRSKEGEQKEC